MAQKSPVPFREWSWNENDAGYDGVHTGNGEITWFTYKGNPHAGGGGCSQSFDQFLKTGPSVSHAPDYVVQELREHLLQYLPGAKNQYPVLKNLRVSPQPQGEVLQVFDWYEGYDGEYEFRVKLYKNCIVWHLEFDEQWTDPPENAVQDLQDYLDNGAPGIFDRPSSYGGIEEAVKAILGRK